MDLLYLFVQQGQKQLTSQYVYTGAKPLNEIKGCQNKTNIQKQKVVAKNEDEKFIENTTYYLQNLAQHAVGRCLDNTLITYQTSYADSYYRHRDSSGKLLAELKLNKIQEKKQIMISQEELLIIYQQSHTNKIQLLQWNFIKNERTILEPFPYSDKSYQINQLLVFQQSKVLCVWEDLQIKQKHNRQFKLYFYQLPLQANSQCLHKHVYKCQKKQDKQIKIYSVANNYQQFDYIQPRKLSQKQAMIGFFFNLERFRLNNCQIQAYKYDKQSNKGQQLNFTIDFQSCNIKQISRWREVFQGRLTDIWMINPTQFYIQIFTQKNIKNYKQNGYDKKVIDTTKYGKCYNVLWNCKTKQLTYCQFNPGFAHQLQFVNCIRTLNRNMIKFIYPMYTTVQNLDKSAELEQFQFKPIYFITSDFKCTFPQYPKLNEIASNSIQYVFNYRNNYMIQMKRSNKVIQMKLRQFPKAWLKYTQKQTSPKI